MIHAGTFLVVKDNTGAKKVQCIKVLNKSKRKPISLAGMTLVAIKESIVKKQSKIKKSKIQKGLIVQVRSKKVRSNGSCLRTKTNAVLLVNPQGLPLASRIFGLLPQESRIQGAKKLLAAAKLLI
jgi:large subunit ribosomal protein L14